MTDLGVGPDGLPKVVTRFRTLRHLGFRRPLPRRYAKAILFGRDLLRDLSFHKEDEVVIFLPVLPGKAAVEI